MTTEQKQPLADMRGCKSLHEYAVMLEKENEQLKNLKRVNLSEEVDFDTISDRDLEIKLHSLVIGNDAPNYCSNFDSLLNLAKKKTISILVIPDKNAYSISFYSSGSGAEIECEHKSCNYLRSIVIAMIHGLEAERKDISEKYD